MPVNMVTCRTCGTTAPRVKNYRSHCGQACYDKEYQKKRYSIEAQKKGIAALKAKSLILPVDLSNTTVQITDLQAANPREFVLMINQALAGEKNYIHMKRSW